MDYTIDDFYKKVDSKNRDFTKAVNDRLTGLNCISKIENMPPDVLVAYETANTHRCILNFFFHDKELYARLYPEKIGEYEFLLNNLPESMIHEIDKASVCKRMLNPNACNSKCLMGYDFHIKETHYQKCRYNCFQFLVTKESKPVLNEWIFHELCE